MASNNGYGAHIVTKENRMTIRSVPEGHLAPGEALTFREWQVLDLAREGLSHKEIAERLGISPVTVKVHLRFAIARLGARNTTNAVVIAIRRGYISA